MADGTGTPRYCRIVGATSPTATMPGYRVVSDVSECIGPRRAAGPAGPGPSAIAIGKELVPRLRHLRRGLDRQLDDQDRGRAAAAASASRWGVPPGPARRGPGPAQKVGCAVVDTQTGRPAARTARMSRLRSSTAVDPPASSACRMPLGASRTEAGAESRPAPPGAREQLRLRLGHEVVERDRRRRRSGRHGGPTCRPPRRRPAPATSRANATQMTNRRRTARRPAVTSPRARTRTRGGRRRPAR